MSRPCDASYRPADARLLGHVVDCPDPFCAKDDVVVSWDVVEGPAYEPHMFEVKRAKPKGHCPDCRRDEDGKVEDCRCSEVWAA